MNLLTRDDFRKAVFTRDNNKCVICKASGQDAHHIIERRLWPDGGYYLDNGATVCGNCHLKAEQTIISCEELRQAANITHTILPPHLYKDQRYDKWGNPILTNGQRLRGELMNDSSVLRIIDPSVNFSNYVKYPRTYHLPWSPGISKDDRIISDLSELTEGNVVVTEKMDGENTTMYSDHIHARSIDSGNHESRNRVKAIWSKIAYDIPKGWRICGENLYAKHSISYDSLEDYFLLFSIWNEQNICLSWAETLEWAKLLNLTMVKTVFGPGKFDINYWQNLDPHLVLGVAEGYVVRRIESFHYGEFRYKVGKWVRKNHVQTHGGWTRNWTVNKLKT